MERVTAQAYGDALFTLAKEKGNLKAVRQEAVDFRRILEEHPEIPDLMQRPGINVGEKQQFLGRLFHKKVSPETEGLLWVLVENSRFASAPEVLGAFLEQERKYRQAAVGRVVTPFPLTKAQRWKVKRRLLKSSGCSELDLTYEVDPALIGGIIFRVGDRVTDCSIRGRLEDLTRWIQRER